MTRFPTSLRQTARLGAVALMTAFALSGAAVAAQSDDAAHPAHIHAGTCEQLGDVVVPLVDVAFPTGDQMGPESGHPVKVGEASRVDIPFDEIVGGGHAINIHLSAEEIGTYIACGDIGGIVNEREANPGREIYVGLAELNDSGHTGVAWLGEDGDGTLVGLLLIEPGAFVAGAAEAAQETASASDAAAESMAVEIKGFAFNPPTITVPAGGSVTWTNQDNAPHTATGMDREVLQSGTLKFGDSYTQTFDTAGSFDYFCEFHANMKGTIVVE